MDTVTFWSPGELDLAALTTFGLHAKPATRSPIGHFGTGLKYALAVLARLDQRVVVETGGRAWRLAAAADEFRGVAYRRLALESDRDETLPLPFTTDLGRHWEPWAAYRELYCNALDEGGGALGPGETHADSDPTTRITVAGPALARVHAERRRYFVGGERPLEDLGEVAVFPTPGCYRRGIRVSDAIYYPCVLGYDVRGGELELTEDRTLRHHYEAEVIVRLALARSERPELLRQVLTAPHGTFEHAIGWNPRGEYGETFRATLAELARTRPDRLAPAARTLSYEILPPESRSRPAELRRTEAAALERARSFLRRRGAPVDEYPVAVVETLGEGCYGLARGGTAYLSRAVFDMGAKFVASTWYEELLHLSRGYSDYSRELQNHLLNALVGAWEELEGEAL